MSVLIREEQRNDISGIREVLLEAFPTSAEADLVEALRQNGSLTVSVVAEDQGRIVGHIGFSPVTIGGERTDALGLAPVAVASSHRSKGIGGKLIQNGLERCQARGTAIVVVLGHESYYPRFGFQRALSYGLENEYGADEHFMALELLEGALSHVRGMVRFGPEFQPFANEEQE